VNGDIKVAEHANSDQSEVVGIGEGAKRERLSRRETQLLRFAIQGLTNNEIASRVRLSATAVKRQLRSTFASLASRAPDRLGGGPEIDEPAPGGDAGAPAAEATARRE
jgi:FixJ family two-component response regulator